MMPRPLCNMSVRAAELEALQAWHDAFEAATDDGATYEAACLEAEEAREAFLAAYWSEDNAKDYEED